LKAEYLLTLKPKLMRIRDSHAGINNDTAVHEMPSGGVEILNKEGHALFRINLKEDGNIYVHAGSICPHNGIMLADKLQVTPVAANAIEVARHEYKDKG
jgi:hypothetical protein